MGSLENTRLALRNNDAITVDFGEGRFSKSLASLGVQRNDEIS
jgi:hypothetical protein